MHRLGNSWLMPMFQMLIWLIADSQFQRSVYIWSAADASGELTTLVGCSNRERSVREVTCERSYLWENLPVRGVTCERSYLWEELPVRELTCAASGSWVSEWCLMPADYILLTHTHLLWRVENNHMLQPIKNRRFSFRELNRLLNWNRFCVNLPDRLLN